MSKEIRLDYDFRNEPWVTVRCSAGDFTETEHVDDLSVLERAADKHKEEVHGEDE